MLLQTSDEAERRTLTLVGVVVTAICLAVVGPIIAFDPFGGRPKDAFSVVIDTPYIGQGVVTGTAMVMHGVTVGRITSVSSLPGGGVRLNADLKKLPTVGLTDTMEIDFRPVNYFGVTGINLSAGIGGRPLHDGMRINAQPRGNFALQALLTRLGQITTGVVTPQLISVIDRVTRYTDSLNPLVETMLIAANAVAEVQTVSTKQLLTNTTGVSVAFPGFINSLVDAGDYSTHTSVNFANRGIEDLSDEDFWTKVIPTMEEAQHGLFGAVGKLLSSHVGDLHPVTDIVKALFDVVPPLIRPEAIAEMLVELRSRFEQMYGGTAEQRALQVRIVLDALPGVAAPIELVGGP